MSKNAIRYIDGGQYNSEHGGYEQTNGKASNSLKTLPVSVIAAACEATYDESNGSTNNIHSKVKEHHICGRASGESHESVHCQINKRKEAMIGTSSTEKMQATLYARSTANLKPGITEGH